MACPRECGVDRLHNRVGQCLVGRKAVVSSAFPHFGEEAPLQVSKHKDWVGARTWR